MPEHATDDATTTATAGDTGLRTIPALVDRNATEFGDLPALSTLDEPRTTVTWRELRDRAVAFGRGLADLGLEPGDRMLISASSRPEHWVADLGAVHLGAVPATTYATLSSPQLRYIAAHSKAKVIVAEDGEQLQRWLPVLDELPDLRHVVVLGSETPPEGPRFLTFTDVAARGEALHGADP
jgi:long-chain acyl-CoA synthetase